MARVMVIDDEPDIRDALALVLESDGHEVFSACDGSVALELMRGQRPDVVILDLMMPRMNGWEFRREQLKQPGLSKIPVIVISAFSAHEPIDANEFLPKPFDPTRLLELVAKYSALS